jgi:hypothetical protein
MGPRAGVVAAAAVVAVVLVWWPARWGRLTPVAAARGAVVAAGGATVVAATTLRPARADGTGERVADRIAGRDLPPVAVYAVVVTGVVLLGVCAVLARGPRSDRSAARLRGRRGPLGAGIGAGLVAAVAGGVVALAVGSLARGVVDRRSDAGELWRTSPRDAVRLDESPGPAPPAVLAWEHDLSSHSTVLAAHDVPGWDVVVAVVEETAPDLDVEHTRIVALSKTDGAELWSVERPGWYGGVAVDPDDGRVLTLYVDAVEVLDLRDGTEVTTRSLPSSAGGGEGWYLLGDGPQALGTAPTGAARVVVGPSAIVLGPPVTDDGVDPPRLAAVDVSSGRLVDSVEATDGCVYTADTSGPSPVVLQSGGDGGDDCGDPAVWAVDDAGELVSLAEIGSPDGVEACDLFCGQTGILAAGDAILVTMVWDKGGDPVSDLAVLAADGAERWRASDASGGPLPGPIELVAVDGDRAVAGWDGQWRTLSLADGTELARQAEEGAGSLSTVADADRFHYQPGTSDEAGDEVSVRRLDDLEPLGEIAHGPSEHPAFSTAGHLVTAHDHGFAAYAAEATSPDP